MSKMPTLAMAKAIMAFNPSAEAIARAFDAAVAEGAKQAITKAKQWYRELHSGLCRLPSLGDACRCFLCRCDELLKSLDESPPTG